MSMADVLDGHDWKVAGMLCAHLIELAETEIQLDYPISLVIVSKADPDVVLMQIVKGNRTEEFELGPCCPVLDRMPFATAPLICAFEDSGGRYVEWPVVRGRKT